MSSENEIIHEGQKTRKELIEQNFILQLKEKWEHADAAMSKFLRRAMRIIEDNIVIGDNGEPTIKFELFQELLDDLKERNIFEGKIITFMCLRGEGEKERLIVAASTKEKTDEGEEMKGLTCGSIAHAAHRDDLLKVKMVDDVGDKYAGGTYVGKSYMYPIVDVDEPGERREKYGLISIAKLEKRYLPDNYIELLINMGEVLGRQMGRVIERKGREVELERTNIRLEDRKRELEEAVDSIKSLLKERGNRIALQMFLFGTINHDFKHKLMDIKSQVDTLLNNADGNTNPVLDSILFSITDTLEMINMIDDLERVEKQIISVGYFFQDYRKYSEHFIRSECAKKGIRITWDLSAKGKVFFDRRHLRRVMNNLILNAIKYSTEKMEIHVAARIAEKDFSSFLEITVSDNGVGIDKKDLEENIFKTRWRSKKVSKVEGTGIGLSYVKYITAKCDGEIKAESRPGRTNKAGTQFVTTFILNIPVCTEQQIAAVEGNLKNRQKVLVIGEIGKDNLYVNQELQYLVEDLRHGLEIRELATVKDVDMAINRLINYGIVVCCGNPDNNESLIHAAKKNNSVVVCLEENNGKVFVIYGESIESVPVESFLISVSKLICPLLIEEEA